MTALYSTEQIYQNLSNYSSADEHCDFSFSSYECDSNGYLHTCSFGISPRNGITRLKGMNIFIALDIFVLLPYNKVVPVFRVSSNL